MKNYILYNFIKNFICDYEFYIIFAKFTNDRPLFYFFKLNFMTDFFLSIILKNVILMNFLRNSIKLH